MSINQNFLQPIPINFIGQVGSAISQGTIIGQFISVNSSGPSSIADYTSGGGSTVIQWHNGNPPQTLTAVNFTNYGAITPVEYGNTVIYTLVAYSVPQIYDQVGTYSVDITVTDQQGNSITICSTVDIQDVNLVWGENGAIIDKNEVKFEGVFYQNTLANRLGDFYSLIDWGDGSPTSIGHVVNSSVIVSSRKIYNVLAKHLYPCLKDPATYYIKVVVIDVNEQALTFIQEVIIPATAIATPGALNIQTYPLVANKGDCIKAVVTFIEEGDNKFPGSAFKAKIKWNGEKYHRARVEQIDNTSQYQVKSDYVFKYPGIHSIKLYVNKIPATFMVTIL